MNLKQRVQRARALAFAKQVDRVPVPRGTPAPIRVDNTAPAPDGSRECMDTLGVERILTGQALGVIATPSSYRIWRDAGKPAHPIYNATRYRVERYVNNVALPTCGTGAGESAMRRHDADCACIMCTEYRVSMERRRTPDTRISPEQVRVGRVPKPPLRFPLALA